MLANGFHSEILGLAQKAKHFLARQPSLKPSSAEKICIARLLDRQFLLLRQMAAILQHCTANHAAEEWELVASQQYHLLAQAESAVRSVVMT
jgi:hypothetical protein